MKDILLIRGGDSRDIIDALWVADEIADAMGEDVQIDIAVPEAYAAYARLSTSVRRVIALPAVEHFSAGADDEAGDSGGGAGDAASVATGAAKKLFSFAKNVAASAGGNLRAYKAVAGDLRLVKYDTVFDFDSSGASLAVARLLKVKEIVGFDEKNIKSPLPGATMMYHATHHISGDTSNSMRLRQLAARYFSYEAKKRDCKIPRTETTTPAQPYVIIDGSVPDAFLQVLRDGGFNLVNVDSEADDALPAVEIVELARHATAVVGNGAATALSSILGGQTLFIGDKCDMPEKAHYITTPAILAEAMAEAATKPPPSAAPADSPSSSSPDASPSSPPSSTETMDADEMEFLGSATPAATDNAEPPAVKKIKLPGH